MTGAVSGTSALISPLLTTSTQAPSSSNSSSSNQVDTGASGTQSGTGDQPSPQGGGLSGISALLAAFSAASGFFSNSNICPSS